ncbi:MAG: cation:proton antiporter [Actinomycetales bacterium]
MSEAIDFGGVVGVAALVLGAAVLGNRVSQWLRLPAPLIFLVAAGVGSDLFPSLGRLSIVTVQQIVTVALIVILFDGGMHIGWGRFRRNAAAITWIGVVGTLATAGALAVVGHIVFGLSWRDALLVGTALAPTDPAVVFSVLGARQIQGRSGVLLEGESGANDPVGIALMAAILAASSSESSGVDLGSVADGGREFVLELGLGAIAGLVGGRLILSAVRRISLPAEALYPLLVLAAAGALFGGTTVVHGSGYLAVFVAGIVLGDERAPYKIDIERFHSALASLGEIIAFTVLGLTVHLTSLDDGNAWAIGLGLALVLTVVVRPVVVGLVVMPLRLHRSERLFVLWAGLRGAVPILLATFVLQDQLSQGNPAGGTRLYDIVIVVVTFSVLVQGGLVPTVARAVGVPMRVVEPQPWAAGVRLSVEPADLRHYVVGAGSRADGCSVRHLPVGEDVWVSLVVRDGGLLQVRGDTVLHAGDDIAVIAQSDQEALLAALFGGRPGEEVH